jgi:hypothetical protein
VRRAAVLAALLLASLSARGLEPASPWLSDLSTTALEAVRAAGGVEGDPPTVLARVRAAEPGYRFAAGPFSVRTDRRWFSTLPEAGPASAALEVRRWPGDTVLALYALSGESLSVSADTILLGSRLEPGSSTVDERRFEGTIDTEGGPRHAIWIERKVGRPGGRLGALLVPGDAGLGEGASEVLREELLFALASVEVDPKKWIADMERTVAVPPRLGTPPDARDEKRDPWQVAEAATFTLGLPPGLRARRLDVGIPAPREVPGAALWIRGCFADRDGLSVVVGDGERAGYVAEVAGASGAWASGERPPLGAPQAKRVDGDVLDATIQDWTGAHSGRVDHYREQGFDGDWLVFRLSLPGKGVEIGLPVVKGWRSLALFWIPFTWRAAGRAAAPPPIDPAERFGIRFQQLSRAEQKRAPMVHGYLTAPGLRAELPPGWWPIASLKTADGFPISIVDKEGAQVARLDRIPSPKEPPGPGWTALPRPSARNARAVYAGANGAHLYVAREGHAFLLERLEDREVDEDLWAQVAGNVVLTRPRP